MGVICGSLCPNYLTPTFQLPFSILTFLKGWRSPTRHPNLALSFSENIRIFPQAVHPPRPHEQNYPIRFQRRRAT
jgi:hypothetical protein